VSGSALFYTQRLILPQYEVLSSIILKPQGFFFIPGQNNRPCRASVPSADGWLFEGDCELDNQNDNIDGQVVPDDFESVDKLIAAAASATDAGDYKTALAGFKQALELARGYFGENLELTELENTISEINELLKE